MSFCQFSIAVVTCNVSLALGHVFKLHAVESRKGIVWTVRIPRFALAMQFRCTLGRDLGLEIVLILLFFNEAYFFRLYFSTSYIYIQVTLTMSTNCVISDFCLESSEGYALLCCYAVSSCDFLPTFRHKLSVPSSEVKGE